MFGYGLAGFACWRWIIRFQGTTADPLQGTPSRWMAAASVVTAAGWAAITDYYYQSHRSALNAIAHGAPSLDVLDPHYRLRMAGGLSLVVGLLLATVGFWIAPSGTSTAAKSIEAKLPVP
jgi:cbb3-type cytochrome oxidase subunit 1